MNVVLNKPFEQFETLLLFEKIIFSTAKYWKKWIYNNKNTIIKNNENKNI